jgi:hypothetical protein
MVNQRLAKRLEAIKERKRLVTGIWRCCTLLLVSDRRIRPLGKQEKVNGILLEFFNWAAMSSTKPCPYFTDQYFLLRCTSSGVNLPDLQQPQLLRTEPYFFLE